LIEGIGDDVITLLFLLFLVVIVIMSWLSTNVRDLPRPTNFYFIERSTGRLFTANSLDGNLHVLSDPSRHQSTSSLRGSSLRASSDSMSRVGSQFRGEDLTTSSNSGGSDFTSSSSSSRISSSNDSTENSSSGSSTGGARRSSNHELDIVDELVEQALVDNLLDGNITYTHRPPHLDENVVNAATTTMSSSNSDASLHAATTSMANDIATGDSVNQQAAAAADEDFIDIFVRFVNEREIKLRVKPNDTISFLKRTHFSQELSNNKIVRFIYQGQFLNEKATIRSYNIKDQTTIHCHITTKQLTAEATRNVTSAFNVDQQEAQTTTPIVLTTTTTTTTTTTSSSSLIQSTSSSTTTQSSTVNSPIEEATATPMQQQQRQQLEPVIDMISLLLNHCILPLLAGLLTGCWYFRINFKHLFTPLTTLILVIFTFLYALFLFIYIHSTSAYVFNSFFMINRNHPHMATSLVQRRRNRPHHLHVHND